MTLEYKASEWGKLFHSLRVNELLGAGAAGPGKSMVLLFDPLEQILIEHQRCYDKHHPHFQRWGQSTGWALHLRRESPMLQETIQRSQRFFPQIDPNAHFDTKLTTWTFSSGFKYQFGHCQHDSDWGNYLSKQYTHIGFDELTQFNEEQYHQVSARLRSGDPVLRPLLKIRACSNPFCKREKSANYTVNDPHWVRKRFVDPEPNGRVILRRVLKRRDGTKFERTMMYLPATLYDNPDKDFVQNYEEQLIDKPAHIRQAMLYGDWYVTVGSHYADDWNKDIHVCDPFKIPSHWRISRSMDWGFKSWGVILWWALDPDGTLYCIREFSFRLMDAAKVAARVKEIEKELGLWHGGRSRITGPADTQLWEERGDTGISKAQEFARAGVMWKPANKRSRARNSQLLIKRLKAHSGGMTIPGIVFFRSCVDCIRTIPGIQTDANDPEAPLEGGDDHWHDAVVYECAEIEKPGVGTSKDRARESYEREDEEDDGPQDRGRYGYGSKVL